MVNDSILTETAAGREVDGSGCKEKWKEFDRTAWFDGFAFFFESGRHTSHSVIIMTRRTEAAAAIMAISSSVSICWIRFIIVCCYAFRSESVRIYRTLVNSCYH